MKKLSLALAAAATLGLALLPTTEASARPGHGWRGHHGGHFARHHWRGPHWGHRRWAWRRPALGFVAAPVYGAVACDWARVRTPWGPRWRRVCL